MALKMDIDQDTVALIKIEIDPLTTESYPETSYQVSEDIKPLCTDVTVEVVSVEPRCLNCGCNMSHKKQHKVAQTSAEVINVIRRWIAPQLITDDNQICHSCFIIALRERKAEAPQAATNDKQRHLCVACKRSLVRKRSHKLNTSSERETGIRNAVLEEIAPRQLSGTEQICHPCWQRFDRKLKTPPPKPETLPSVIHLPNIVRPADTQSHCFYPNCNATERKTIPRSLRVKLFMDHKFYIPVNCKSCSYHLANHDWDVLKCYPNFKHTFTADHIEDFASFVNERCSIIDFQNIEEMTDKAVKYWTGLTKEQFKNVYEALPQLENTKNGQIALAAYLMKIKTGDPTVKISNLLNIPRTTLSRMMVLARNVLHNLQDDVVPREIGININNDNALNSDGDD